MNAQNPDQSTDDVSGVRGDVIDFQHLSLCTFDDVDLQKELLGIFDVQCDSLFERIFAAKSDQELQLAAHTLKGSAAGLGMVAIAATAALIEKNGINGNTSYNIDLRSQLSDDIAAFRQVKEQLNHAA